MTNEKNSNWKHCTVTLVRKANVNSCYVKKRIHKIKSIFKNYGYLVHVCVWNFVGKYVDEECRDLAIVTLSNNSSMVLFTGDLMEYITKFNMQYGILSGTIDRPRISVFNDYLSLEMEIDRYMELLRIYEENDEEYKENKNMNMDNIAKIIIELPDGPDSVKICTYSGIYHTDLNNITYPQIETAVEILRSHADISFDFMHKEVKKQKTADKCKTTMKELLDRFGEKEVLDCAAKLLDTNLINVGPVSLANGDNMCGNVIENKWIFSNETEIVKYVFNDMRDSDLIMAVSDIREISVAGASDWLNAFDTYKLADDNGKHVYNTIGSDDHITFDSKEEMFDYVFGEMSAMEVWEAMAKRFHKNTADIVDCFKCIGWKPDAEPKKEAEIKVKSVKEHDGGFTMSGTFTCDPAAWKDLIGANPFDLGFSTEECAEKEEESNSWNHDDEDWFENMYHMFIEYLDEKILGLSGEELCEKSANIIKGGPIKCEPDNDPVNKPNHYCQTSIECIDSMKLIFTRRELFYIGLGQAYQYIWRNKHKNGKEDLDKARWWLNMCTELGSDETVTSNPIKVHDYDMLTELTTLLNKQFATYAEEEKTKCQ